MDAGLFLFIAVPCVALVAVLAMVVSLRNGIVSAKNRVKRAWADVIAYERKKLKVIPAIEKGLRDHQAYESGVFEKITALRSSVGRLSSAVVSPQQLREVAQVSEALLSGLRVTVEAYPTLKTSELYASWMRELAEAEENITAAIAIFNGTVQGFNDGIQEFPGNVVNSWFNQEQPLETFTDSAAQGEFEYQPTFVR